MYIQGSNAQLDPSASSEIAYSNQVAPLTSLQDINLKPFTQDLHTPNSISAVDGGSKFHQLTSHMLGSTRNLISKLLWQDLQFNFCRCPDKYPNTQAVLQTYAELQIFSRSAPFYSSKFHPIWMVRHLRLFLKVHSEWNEGGAKS